MKTSNINELKSIYPQLNAPQVSRRSLLALGSIFALELAGCGGRGQDQSNPPASPSYTNAGVVTTLAGSSSAGFVDGTGVIAQFTSPSIIAVDASGTIYVADVFGCAIRKITPAGVVSTLAGGEGSDYKDGTGSAAMFVRVGGIAVDANGTVYVTDSLIHVIRKITPEGVVTTFAGTPNIFGYTDGPLASALFAQPQGLAIDAAGNLYVAEPYNHLIRKITPAGEVTTVAGTQGVSGSLDGTGVNASFNRPYGITVDANGNLYITDNGNHMIRKISSEGVVTTLAGTTTKGGVDGIGSAARFSGPRGISVDTNGNLYVGEYNNNAIRKIAIATGEVTSFAGVTNAKGYVDAAGSDARFSTPQGVAVGPDGYIYVADTDNNMIRKIA
jgi:streptogramin lyase